MDGYGRICGVLLLSGFIGMTAIKLNCVRPLCRQFSALGGVFCNKSAVSLENIYPKKSFANGGLCFEFVSVVNRPKRGNFIVRLKARPESSFVEVF